MGLVNDGGRIGVLIGSSQVSTAEKILATFRCATIPMASIGAEQSGRVLLMAGR
jgi:hypothetical protein